MGVPCFAIFLGAFVAIALTIGSASAQESPFKLEPAAPRVDEPFEVILVADAAAAPEGVRYDWFVSAKTAGNEVEPSSAGVPDPRRTLRGCPSPRRE